MQERIEFPEAIINKLFTGNFKGWKDKKGYNPVVKQKYAEYLLARNWTNILGEHLAQYCCVHKINGTELVIHTANSVLANELFMMKDLLLQKMNSCLEGKLIIKKISFQANSKIKQYDQFKIDNTENLEVKPKVYTKPCSKCGVIVQSDNDMCDVCTREEKNILKYKIAELLKVQPWMKFEECQTYHQCDKLLFNAVKDSLQNMFFERVRLETADEYDCQMAVMFLTGKAPEEINDKIYENSLAYLRRNGRVLTSGIRLHGKK